MLVGKELQSGERWMDKADRLGKTLWQAKRDKAERYRWAKSDRVDRK